jgi:hypothetical protein
MFESQGTPEGDAATDAAAASGETDVTAEADKAATDALEGADVQDERKIMATIPITLDDKLLDMVLYEGQSAEEAVVEFCRSNLTDDVAGCIRELLPTVLERLAESAESAGGDAAIPVGGKAAADETP